MTGARELAERALTLLENTRETARTPGYSAQGVIRSGAARVQRMAMEARPFGLGGAAQEAARKILNAMPRRVYVHRWTEHELDELIGELRRIAGPPQDGAAAVREPPGL